MAEHQSAGDGEVEGGEVGDGEVGDGGGDGKVGLERGMERWGDEEVGI